MTDQLTTAYGPERTKQVLNKILDAMDQQPDPAPGIYYVSVRNAGKTGLLAGPYSNHAEALGLVERVRRIAERVDSWSAFYAFGTCKTATDCGRGVLMDLLEAELVAEQSANLLPAGFVDNDRDGMG